MSDGRIMIQTIKHQQTSKIRTQASRPIKHKHTTIQEPHKAISNQSTNPKSHPPSVIHMEKRNYTNKTERTRNGWGASVEIGGWLIIDKKTQQHTYKKIIT